MSLEVIQPKNTVKNHQHTFSHFLAPRHLVLTNVVKRPDNFEFSEKNVRSHDGGGSILKVIKA
jgi:hypothetical protein